MSAPNRVKPLSSKCRINGCWLFSRWIARTTTACSMKLLASDPKFQELVAKSKGGPRQTVHIWEGGANGTLYGCSDGLGRCVSVAIAESRGHRRLFTIDSDFYTYRHAGGSVLEVVR